MERMKQLLVNGTGCTCKRRIQAAVLMMLTVLMMLSGCGIIMESGTEANKKASQTSVEAGINETESSTLNVHFIDVGQGDSILIESDNRYMLVDAGENDQGDTVVSYLRSLGVEQLDYVIGTHPHSDHIGGLDVVINAFSVNKVIMPKVPHNTKTYEDVLMTVAEKGLKITTPKNGEVYTLGDSKFEIVSSDKDYGDELNNWSVGIKVTNGEHSFLMCGDAEVEAEEDMVNGNIDLSADVLKVSHHGSDTSTSDAFLKKVNPTYAVISLGADNTYGHPSESTMNKLDGIQIFRTDEQGTIVATSDGKMITWSTNIQTNQAGDVVEQSLVNELENEVENDGPLVETQMSNSEYVHISDMGKKYHRAGCRYLKESDSLVSLLEAKEKGLEPCSVCKPPQ